MKVDGRRASSCRQSSALVPTRLIPPAPSGIDDRLQNSTIRGPTAAERINCTIKDATVRRFFYKTHKAFAHLATFLDAYNFAAPQSLRGSCPLNNQPALDRAASKIQTEPSTTWRD
jgi:hypothetical protein